jgi:hypothetical protein
LIDLLARHDKVFSIILQLGNRPPQGVITLPPLLSLTVKLETIAIIYNAIQGLVIPLKTRLYRFCAQTQFKTPKRRLFIGKGDQNSIGANTRAHFWVGIRVAFRRTSLDKAQYYWQKICFTVCVYWSSVKIGKR